MKKLVIALSISALFSGFAQAAHWGYEGEHGPAHWGDVSKTCAEGVNQSPINVTHAVKADIQSLNIQYDGMVTGLTYNGHALQATVEGKNILTVDGDTYQLKQFHFHTPSENYINGKQYAAEAHFVNADKNGNLLVVAVMYDLGKTNPELSKLIKVLPAKGQTIKLAMSFPVKDMLPATATLYRFNGSLTTPPCSEGVRWYVMKDVKQFSSAQEKAMTKVMGHNNRPLQGLHARVVLEK